MNPQEVELHDVVTDIIKRSVGDASFAMETDMTLEFFQPVRLYSEDFVGKEELSPEDLLDIAELTQDEKEACVPEEGGLVDLEYKERAVNHWKSSRKKRLSLERIKQKFRKVQSLSQLYRWKHSVGKGRESKGKTNANIPLCFQSVLHCYRRKPNNP